MLAAQERAWRDEIENRELVFSLRYYCEAIVVKMDLCRSVAPDARHDKPQDNRARFPNDNR